MEACLYTARRRKVTNLKACTTILILTKSSRLASHRLFSLLQPIVGVENWTSAVQGLL